jgi:hypothetical protein
MRANVECEKCGKLCNWLDPHDDEMPSGWFCEECQNFTEPAPSEERIMRHEQKRDQ